MSELFDKDLSEEFFAIVQNKMRWATHGHTAAEIIHAGKISHQIAIDKAKAEYAKYRQQLNELLSPVEKHFIEAIKEVKQIDSTGPRKSPKKRKSS